MQADLTTGRRTFLRRSGVALGRVALASLLPGTAMTRAAEIKRFRPRAKRIIFLTMAGGPSHLETFDHKPRLLELDGKPMPPSVTEGQPIAQLQGKELKCLRPLVPFGRYGQSGQLISDYLPHHRQIADDICIVKSMHTDQINHDPAHTVMNTGTSISGRPSMGSWVTYGLGSETRNLPGFVVLTSIKGRNPQPISSRQWYSGFLPSQYQGVPFQAQGDPIHYVSPPPGVSRRRQREIVETVSYLNSLRHSSTDDAEIITRTKQYELAFRMQTSVPELMDLRDEDPKTLEMYGTQGADGSFASNCLLARRLAERGVRFIQLYHRGWDHHGDLDQYMKICCEATDRATVALLLDLKQRGMLEDTLVIWGGEFGRTPMFQGKGKNAGRDHHIRGFSMWLAGGGIRGGMSYGETDELGYHAVQDRVHVNDLHATMLYLLGLDHERLTYRFQGRDFRLTDVAGRVMHDWIV